MNGIIINIDPVIFHLGAFELRWYSLAIILAIIAAVLITVRLGKKKRIATEKIYSLALWAVIAVVSISIVAMLVSYAFLLPLIFNQLLGLSLAIRLLATVVILTPLGFLMGFPFPLGLRLLKEMSMEDYIPWMWGINGISSVLGSAMAIAIAIRLGLTEALLVAAGCYFVVFLMFQTAQHKESLVLQRSRFHSGQEALTPKSDNLKVQSHFVYIIR